MTQTLRFDVAGSMTECTIVAAYNAGYTGRDQATVKAHIDELREQGVEAPGNIPTLFSVPTYMNLQRDHVEVEHAKTSGEVEWALIYRGSDQPALLTVASDHTDRALEAYDVTSAKQISPNILGSQAWDFDDVAGEFDEIVMRSRVHADDGWTLLQEGTIGDLISPADWIDRLADNGRLTAGIAVLGGTVPMLAPDKQFAQKWEVSLERPGGDAIVRTYDVHRMIPSIS